MRFLLPCSIAVAAVSLLLPSVPSYDPWAWIVWGRELSEFQINTFAGPSWKPLPPMITAVYAQVPGGDTLSASLWLVTVRAAGLVALALAWRLAARLAGGGRTGATAGAIAAVALLISPDYLRYLAHGNEVPLAAALVLAAILSHLDGHARRALCLAAIAALLRPEAFPFLVVYAAFTWRSQPRARPLIAAIAVVVPLLWLGPEWLGSGDPLGGGRKANSAPAWSLASHDNPWLALLRRAHHMAGLPVELAALATLVAGVLRRSAPAVVLGGAALAWTVLVAAMTQAGFSGNARYLSLALVMACVLAGVGAVEIVRLPGSRLAAGAAAAVLLLVAAPTVADRARGFGRQAESAGELAEMHSGLVSAVDRMGGPARVRRLGLATSNRVFQTHLAWVLRVPLDHVERPRGRTTVFRARGRLAGPPPDLRFSRSHVRVTFPLQ